MDINTLIQFATLISVIVGIVGLLITVQGYQKQTKTQVLLQFERRYDEIIRAFPLRAWMARHDLEGEPPEATDELSLCVLLYLTFISQSYHFHKNGYLMKDAWR